MGIGKSNVFLVFEHCRYDLAQIIDAHTEHLRRNYQKRGGRNLPRSPFARSVVKTLVVQLLSALDFCHSHRLIHRDIKPSNLLYDTITGRLKLCDFGLSRIVNEDGQMTPKVVSLWYRAPELLLPPAEKSPRSKGKRVDHGISDSSFSLEDVKSPHVASPTSSVPKYSFAIDMWAVGCVIAELIEGQPFLNGSSEVDQIDKIVQNLGPLPKRLYSCEGLLLTSSSYRTSHCTEHVPNYNCKNNGTRTFHSNAFLDRFQYWRDGMSMIMMFLCYDPRDRKTATQALEDECLAYNSSPRPIQNLRNMPKDFLGC